MLLRKGIRNTLLTNGRPMDWYHQTRNVVTKNASEGEDGGGPESLKLKMFSDPDERRGYKFDGSLDLTALIDKSSAMGFINTTDADGFKSRNLRKGGEPPDPEKAKEILVFFRKRQKPPKQANTTDLRSLLQSSKSSILGHAKDVASNFLKQRTRPTLNANPDSDAASTGRMNAKATDTTSQQQNDQAVSSQIKVKAQPQAKSLYFNKSIGRKGSQSGSNQAANPPPRGSYKISKTPKKQ